MRKLICNCEKEFDSELPEELDIDAQPEELGKIFDGSFMTAVCPHCGAALRPELSLRIHSDKYDLDAFVVPEMDRFEYYDGTMDIPRGMEVLIGYDELLERLSLLTASLDPLASEIVKFYLLGKAVDAAPESSVVIRFKARENDALVYHIHGMKPDEIGIVKVPMETYRNIASDIKSYAEKKPFKRIISGQYRSIRSLENLSEAGQ